MFLGHYTYSLDNKGRVTIPARFREHLQEGLIVTRGLDNCLVVYTMDVWATIVAKINATPVGSPSGRALRRRFFADAADAILDAQGRILVPNHLREFAGFEASGDVVVVGMMDYIELWSPEKWAEQNAQEAAMMEDNPALWENFQF